MKRIRTILHWLREESGQATTEYVAVSTIILMGGLAVTTGWPITKMLFEGLQTYINLYFYALNLAIG